MPFRTSTVLLPPGPGNWCTSVEKKQKPNCNDDEREVSHRAVKCPFVSPPPPCVPQTVEWSSASSSWWFLPSLPLLWVQFRSSPLPEEGTVQRMSVRTRTGRCVSAICSPGRNDRTGPIHSDTRMGMTIRIPTFRNPTRVRLPHLNRAMPQSPATATTIATASASACCCCCCSNGSQHWTIQDTHD